MRPEYEERYKAESATDKVFRGKLKTTTVRLLRIQNSLLGVFAKAEGDTFAGLLREGIMRTIDDRMQDEAYMSSLPVEARALITETIEEQVRFFRRIIRSCQIPTPNL